MQVLSLYFTVAYFIKAVMAQNIVKRESIFGTDGVRGTPGIYPLTDSMVFKIGLSVAKMAQYRQEDDFSCPCVVIGRDTRLTGSDIEEVLTDAITFHGIDVYSAGVITTPGLSLLTKEKSAHIGIMISASHNKPEDNGIKFFNSKGFKFSSEEENFMTEIIASNAVQRVDGAQGYHTGQTHNVEKYYTQYVKFLEESVRGIKLRHLHIALDCGWGAASGFASRLYKEIGFEVTSINDKPRGESINIGGALKPNYLSELVVRNNADIGVALDGDGDRCILIDEKGNILDGDYILAILGNYLIDKNELSKNTIVATVMSNMGLKASLAKRGAKMVITDVGDRNVVDALCRNSLALGGEQSGHIVFLDILPSPDGLLTSLQILKVMSDTGKSLSELSGCMKKFPQVLVNVNVETKIPFNDIPAVHRKLDYFRGKLKDNGRILLRYSGTENIARIMVEGLDEKVVNEVAFSLAETVREEIGIRGK